MSDTKTISLNLDTHKQLKLLCAQEGWTMTQAVESLMERFREKNDNGKVAGARKKPRKTGEDD